MKSAATKKKAIRISPDGLINNHRNKSNSRES